MNRLKSRRYEPTTGERIHLNELSAKEKLKYQNWVSFSSDSSDTALETRFGAYAACKEELKTAYKQPRTNHSGIFYAIKDTAGNTKELLENVQASMLRPVPYDIKLKEVI